VFPETSTAQAARLVVVQHAAQALAALNLARVAGMTSLWADELVRQTLVIAFTVIMNDEVLNGCPQRFLAEKITRSRQDSLIVRTNLSA
jgi:hypothetical protein